VATEEQDYEEIVEECEEERRRYSCRRSSRSRP
jgi:hypothetical protein